MSRTNKVIYYKGKEIKNKGNRFSGRADGFKTLYTSKYEYVDGVKVKVQGKVHKNIRRQNI